MMRNSLMSLFLVTISLSLAAQDLSRSEYIDRFSEIAIAEMDRAGIPASIKLAQGILESNGGKSTLARKAKNHFGIKCHNDWKGKGYYIEDDDYDENGKLIKSCFRVYKNADASYIAHSEFLRDPKKRFRYGSLFNLDPQDYKAWARGLKQAGYATSPTYAEKLIRIIEQYELFRFDTMSLADIGVRDNLDVGRKNVASINDIKITLAGTGETAAAIAARTGTSIKRILKYNEKVKSQNQKLTKDTRVFLQRKRNNYRGKQRWHYVKAGQTLFDISQLYGVKLSKLEHKNRIPKGAEPAEGERIKIRGWFKISKKDTPKLRSKAEIQELEEMEEGGETPIEIEIPVSNEDNEDFGEDLVPDLPVEDVIFEEEEEEIDEPLIDPGTNPGTTTIPDNGNTETEEPPTEIGVFYTIQKGDTLFSISKRYGTTVEGIKRLNNLTSNTISIGQRLRIF